ncbi:MAG: hypothetical protein MJ118_08490, partial [Clostridia bacterium]|nr:hypothetical protein [Clostridia bacterium]
MAILKCRMCGAELNREEDSGTVICRSCGFLQAVPMTASEDALERFAQAAQLLAAREYIKASELYEQLAADFPEDAEPIWGKLLCSRQVDYSPDPIYGDRKPFCRSLPAVSILEDPEFDRVLELADDTRRKAYQSEAALIDEAFQPASGRAAAERVGRGIRALEQQDWEKAEDLFLRVLNSSRESSEACLGLLLTQNRLTTLNEFLRNLQNRFASEETTTETIGTADARIQAIVERDTIPGYLEAGELLPLFAYPLTYESRVKGCSETQQRVSQAIEEEELLAKALRGASGEYREQLESTIQTFRDGLLEATAAAEREAKSAADELQAQYAQHLDQAEKKADELAAAARERREAEYRALCKRQKKARKAEELEALAEAFAAMNGYKESDNRIIVCRKRLEKYTAGKKVRLNRKKLIFVTTAAGVVVVLVAAVLVFRPVLRYNAAKR